MKDPDLEMGVKLNSKSHLENKFRFFEPFGPHLPLMFSKSANITPKFFLYINSCRVSKNIEFYADFKSFQSNAKKFTQKSYMRFNLMHSSKIRKSTYFSHIFRNNFFL